MISDLTPFSATPPTVQLDAPTESLAGAGPSLLFEIPAEARRHFLETVTDEVREEVRTLFGYLRHIHTAKSKSAAMRHIASLPHNRNRPGFSFKSLERKYYSYVRSGGDHNVLINRVKVPAIDPGLPAAFKKFFESLCENNQRCCAGGMRELLVIWRTHHTSRGQLVKAIPGYADWPVAEIHTGLPAGWTERNLYRYLPEAYHLALARKGIAGASQLRLKVHRTRVGLRLGEFIQFDDHEYNLKVNFPGQFKAMRPRGFTAIDVLTAMPFAKSFKPTLWDQEAEMKRTLTERDAAWFIVHVLCDHGYRQDERGTALCVEHGLMAVRAKFEERIIEATNGKVRIERGGKFHTEEKKSRLALSSQFRGAVRGNFRFKALIESFWNIIDNYLAQLPGQVGKDRDHAPEQIAGADAYNNKLLKLERVLPPEIAAKLIKPFYTWPEFLDAALACYQAIETALQHECEGWEDCGFIAKEWRLNELHPWLPFEELLALPDAQRSIAENLINSRDGLRRARRFSRAEAWNAQRAELTPLPAFHWPSLMGLENAVWAGEPVPVESGQLRFTLETNGPVVAFDAIDEYGGRLLDKYVCFVNPFNPDQLVACDAKLRVKAICRPTTVACHNDQAKIKHAMGVAHSWSAKAIRAYEEKHTDEIKAMMDMHAHNGAILSGSTISQDAAKLKTERREIKAAQDADADIIAKYGNSGGPSILDPD